MFVISLRMSIHLLNRYLYVVFFSFFFTSFGGSFKGFDNYHDCVNKIKRVKGMEHLEENCQIKNINVLNISFVISLIGFLMSIFFHLSDNSNANTYVLFVTEELIILTIIKY